MKFYISTKYGCLYWLEDGELFWGPTHIEDGVFDTNLEGGAVDFENSDVPRGYYDKVMEALTK